MPVRVKPPPPEIGDNFSRLSRLRNDHAAEWGTQGGIRKLHIGASHGGLRERYLFVLRRDLRLNRFDLSLRALISLLWNETAGDQAFAAEIPPCLCQLHCILSQQGLRGPRLSVRLRQRRFLRGVFQPRNDLPRLDMLAFLDEYFGLCVRDLSGYGGLAAAGHVAYGGQVGIGFRDHGRTDGCQRFNVEAFDMQNVDGYRAGKPCKKERQDRNPAVAP
jgi:hypothetical protein